MKLRTWRIKFLVAAILIVTLLSVSNIPQFRKKIKVLKNFLTYKLIWNSFYPDHVCPHELTRVGNAGDGGKWVCGISEIKKKGESCIVYSFGIGNDLSFESELLGRTNCTLHIYDHTKNPKKFDWLLKMFKGRVTISKIGIGKKNSRNKRTLKSEMDSRGHHFLELLKMDVEGSEFEALEQIMNDFSHRFPFRQLLVEIHLYALPKNNSGVGIFKTFEDWWRKLEMAGLWAIHNEPNDVCSSCYEFTFLNVKA